MWMLRVADNTQQGFCALSKAPGHRANSLQVGTMAQNTQEGRRGRSQVIQQHTVLKERAPREWLVKNSAAKAAKGALGLLPLP